MPKARPDIPFEGWQQTHTLDLLRELCDTAERVRPAVAERAGLSRSELLALEHLMPEALGPVEVSRRIGVTSAATTGIVDRLAARGHVVREPHETDRRRTQVAITESGRAEVFGYLMPMFRALAEMDGELSDDERRVVDRYLERAIEAFRSVL